MIQEYPTIEEYPAEEAPAAAPPQSMPPIKLSAYQQAQMDRNVDTSGGPFGPAHPEEILALPQILSAPAALIEKSGIPQSLEEIGADFLRRTGINPAAQPGVPLAQPGDSTPPSPLEEAFPNVTKGIEETLRGFTTPGQAVSAPFLGVKAAQTAFKVQMASGIPGALGELAAARTPQDIAKAGSALVAQVLPVLHGINEPAPEGGAAAEAARALQNQNFRRTFRERVEPPIADQRIAAAGAPATAAAIIESQEITQNAIHSKSAQVLRTVQDQPQQGAGEVPASEGGSEAGPRRGAEAQQEIKLTKLEKIALQHREKTFDEVAKIAGESYGTMERASDRAIKKTEGMTDEQIDQLVGKPEEPAPPVPNNPVQDRARYDQLVEVLKKGPSDPGFQDAWRASEEIKNRYEGKPPPKDPEIITAAAYQEEGEDGLTFTGPNHPEILQAAGIPGFETPESRNTPQFGFFTSKKRFVTREQAADIAKASGQNLKQFEPQEPVHSDEVQSPAQPGQALGDVPQPVRAHSPILGPLEAEVEPALQGMGNAIAGEFPEPRQAAVVGATTEQAPPQNRPMGILSNFAQGLREAIGSIDVFLKGAAGETMPKTTKADRVSGELGARYLSARQAALPVADSFVARVLQDTEVDPIKFGALLTEDNLMSIRESLRQEAFELNSKGDSAGADEKMEQAANVGSIIGAQGSPFETTDDMLDYAQDPMVRKALEQHRQLWQEVIDPQYRAARELDDTVQLASRGLNTGARINLKAADPEEAPDPGSKFVGSSSGLTGTYKRRTPFSFKAKGTGKAYDINYQNIIRNTFQKQLEIAAKNKFENQLIETGNAVLGPPGGEPPTLQGESTVSFPSRRGFASQNLYIRKSLANEYKAAAGVTERAPTNPVTKAISMLNRFALYGLTDGTVHISNQLTALFNRPVTGNLMADTLLSATGRADIPVILTKAVIKAFQDNREQMAELAEIGALRPERQHTGIFGGRMGKLLEKTDRLTRVLLDDTFQSLVKQGAVEDTETNRREYVNQIGQYNRRAQGWLMRTLRDTGIGPFATAGRTFNAMGVKMVTLSPGVRGSTAFAETALRANVLSKWVGAAVLIGTLNWLLTKDKGGGLMGRPGTKLGDVDLGINDKKGNALSLPVASIIGVGRGLRVTGIKGAVDAKRMGLSNADALDAASRDVINSWTGPAAGPAVKFTAAAFTGYPPAVKVNRISPVAPPGESQFAANVWAALKEVSPILSTYNKIKSGASLQEILATQLPRLAPIPGKTEATVRNYPHIVTAARANEFIDFVVHETRRTEPDKRLDYAQQQIDRLPPEYKKKAWDELKRRKVFAQ